MRIKVLADNRPNTSCPELAAEHGLSFFIETDWQQNILCDMGASLHYVLNAGRLHVPLHIIDFAFLSHAHADHSGGLKMFLQTMQSKPVYLSPHCFDAHYFSNRQGSLRDISINFELRDMYPDRLRFVSQSQFINEHTAIVACQCNDFFTPFGNSHLSYQSSNGQIMPDPFLHELALTFITPKGLVIVSPCSHHGAANIIRSCQQFTGVDRVVAFIGGLHFVNEQLAFIEAKQLSDDLQAVAPEAEIHTGHCTCDNAIIGLQQLDCNVSSFHVGQCINIDCSV